MTKPTKKSIESTLAAQADHAARLTELEVEIRPYPIRPSQERPLKSIDELERGTRGDEPVVQFSFCGKRYAAGHTDRMFAQSNFARGVRHIRFYEEEKAVFDIEGNFENHDFGSNFHFQNVTLYIPGDWEGPFVKLTDELRAYRKKRRQEFQKSRARAMRTPRRH